MSDAARTIVRTEGPSALFHGYRATLYRDLPFSALQFMFYEQFQSWAHQWRKSKEIGWQMELLTGAAAGGLAGTITCPLDVVKTRLQTQVTVPEGVREGSPAATGNATAAAKTQGTIAATTKDGQHAAKSAVETTTTAKTLQKRLISTSSPSTHTPRPGAVVLDTSSVITGLKIIYRTEGIGGWFRGVGPRAVWTSIQSGCMLFLYQNILRRLETIMPIERSELA